MQEEKTKQQREYTPEDGVASMLECIKAAAFISSKDIQELREEDGLSNEELYEIQTSIQMEYVRRFLEAALAKQKALSKSS